MLHPVDDARNGLNIQFLAAHNLISHVYTSGGIGMQNNVYSAKRYWSVMVGTLAYWSTSE